MNEWNYSDIIRDVRRVCMPSVKWMGKTKHWRSPEKESCAKVLKELSLTLDHNYVDNQIDRSEVSNSTPSECINTRWDLGWNLAVWERCDSEKLTESYEGRVYEVSISSQLFLISGSFLCPLFSPILICLHFPLFLSFVHIQVMVMHTMLFFSESKYPCR